MNHDRIGKANRLRSMALRFERGELDAEFAEAQVPIADMRETVVQRIRQLADTLESGGE